LLGAVIPGLVCVPCVANFWLGPVVGAGMLLVLWE
jgi:hypothetical protein